MQSTAEKIIDLIWQKPRTTTFDYYVNGVHARCDMSLLNTRTKINSINSFVETIELALELDKVESDTVTKIYFKADTSKYEKELEELQINLEGIYVVDKEEEINDLLDATCEVMGLPIPSNVQRLMIFSKFNKKVKED